MSFLSTLLKIGGVAAAPFSGGASLGLTGLGSALGAAGSAGSMMGAQQGGANNARVAQGQLNNNHDRNAIDLFGSQQHAQDQAAQTDMQRKAFTTSDRSASAKQALIGALLGGGMTPTSFSGGHASGGLMRSLNANPSALAAMQTLGGQGSTAQHTPLEFQGGQMVAPPTLSEVPKIDTGSGGFMNNLMKIAQIAGSVSPFLTQGAKSQGPPTDMGGLF